MSESKSIQKRKRAQRGVPAEELADAAEAREMPHYPFLGPIDDIGDRVRPDVAIPNPAADGVDRAAPVLSMWVVYGHPRDYPAKYVVRKWRVQPGGAIEMAQEPWCVADTIEAARESLPTGLYRLERQENDDPAIMEVWV